MDAMTALADFQLQMDDAQKSGKITLDQLTSGRDKLFDKTQSAQEKKDWTAYCKAIDATGPSWDSSVCHGRAGLTWDQRYGLTYRLVGPV